MNRHFVFRFLLTGLLAALLPLIGGVCTADPAPNAGEVPRIAVWDPEGGTIETRFRLDPAEPARVVAGLRKAGLEATALTSAQLDDGTRFSAERYDALILPGDVFPARNVPALTAYANAGGVLVALHTLVPFLIAIEPEADGRWTMAPKTPTFAWQRQDISKLFGLKYEFRPEFHDSGVNHEPSALLKRYLPGAITLNRPLEQRWIYPAGEAEVYPLLRSVRADGADFTPQIYIARLGKCTAIVASGKATVEGLPGWPAPAEVIAGLARLASDLKRGKASPDAATRLTGLNKLQAPPPLLQRFVAGAIDPTGTRPVARWGAFNGSGIELPETASPAKPLARSLAPGQQATLPLPAGAKAGAPLFVRVRGAFAASDTGLAISAVSSSGKQLLWNELFNYINSREAGNHNPAVGGLPTEFTRIVFLPPVAGAKAAPVTSLLVSNPGKQPVYFDALQVEERTAPAPLRIIGLGGGTPAIPVKYSQSWTSMRINPRPQFIGPPGDPKRWDVVDRNMKASYGANTHLHVVLEGTPEWAAISPERYAEGVAARRPHTVVPDPQKYAGLVADFIERYGDKVEIYELWNETDITQYWRGTTAEYVQFVDTVLPVIRKLAPRATVVSAGMSGFKDGWVGDVVQGKVPERVDLFGYHPYIGKTAGWDQVYGLVQGALQSRGQANEIFCDESGFTFFNGEWFTAPPVCTPATQARMLSIGTSRLLASDLAKLSVFNAGGDENPYGLFNGKGELRPAYHVYEQYVPLGQNGGRRLDVSLTSATDEPLKGLYSAASSHSNGSATIVINPSEVEAFQVVPDPSTEFNNTAGWTAFFGKAQAQKGVVTVTPDAGKTYAGFYTGVRLGAGPLPTLELAAPGTEGGYDLVFKLADGKQVTAATKQAAGTLKLDLGTILPAGTREFELSLRVYGVTSFDSLRFIGPASGATPPKPILVRLRVPLEGTGAYTASAVLADANGNLTAVPARLVQNTVAGTAWAEVEVPVSGITSVVLKPAA